MTRVLFVSLNKSFDRNCSLPELESCVERAWPITATKAAQCDRVVAVVNGDPVAAWRVRGVFPTEETYQVRGGRTSPRIGLSLGDPLPILPEYGHAAGLRRGVMVVECDVDPLPSERRRSIFGDED